MAGINSFALNNAVKKVTFIVLIIISTSGKAFQVLQAQNQKPPTFTPIQLTENQPRDNTYETQQKQKLYGEIFNFLQSNPKNFPYHQGQDGSIIYNLRLNEKDMFLRTHPGEEYPYMQIPYTNENPHNHQKEEHDIYTTVLAALRGGQYRILTLANGIKVIEINPLP